MVKRFWKLYRSVILCVAICIAVLACSAGYTVGVVGMNNVIAQIDVNIGSIEAYLEKNQNATELLTEEFKEDYSAKTRTIAMLLSQDSSFITDDRTLEELRVTVNADMISISDHEGNVIASTDPSGAGNSIREEFRSHLTDDVYTDVLFLLDSDTPTIVAASSLDGGNGLVQITFSADSVVSLLQDADWANIASDMPLYSSGTTAILETDTLKYISCTNAERLSGRTLHSAGGGPGGILCGGCGYFKRTSYSSGAGRENCCRMEDRRIKKTKTPARWNCRSASRASTWALSMASR